MYKYDIPYPKKDQYVLLFNTDSTKTDSPINMAKSVPYLKAKMKAHRDAMVELGYDDKAFYCILAPNKDIVFTKTFQKGERGNSKVPYHVESPKPDINYREAYLYDRKGDIVIIEKTGVFAEAVYNVVCNDAGEVITDLKLLKLLGDFIFYEPVPVMVTRKAQVSIATYLPQTKEEFAKLPGCGEKLYDKCGEKIINFVNEYLKSKKLRRPNEL